VKRELSAKIKQQLDSLIRQSVEFALANPEESQGYVSEHAQEMEEKIMRKHIELYVNDFSVDLGSEGKGAVGKLFEMASEKGVIESPHQELFLS